MSNILLMLDDNLLPLTMAMTFNAIIDIIIERIYFEPCPTLKIHKQYVPGHHNFSRASDNSLHFKILLKKI